MKGILKLQKMQMDMYSAIAEGNSNGSSTCVGVSCTSNGCVPKETQDT